MPPPPPCWVEAGGDGEPELPALESADVPAVPLALGVAALGTTPEAPAGSVPVSVVFPELGAERTYVWRIPGTRG